MPQAKTYILRSTNTSFKLLEMYLLQLQVAGLIELQANTKRYITTGTGQRFIETWIKLKSMLYPQDLPIAAKSKKCVIFGSQLIVPSSVTKRS